MSSKKYCGLDAYGPGHPEQCKAIQIEAGWRFMSADFSVQANGKDSASGFVTLVRDPDEKSKWHNLPEKIREDDDGPPLYVVGHGHTLNEAITNANLMASHVKTISAMDRDDE